MSKKKHQDKAAKPGGPRSPDSAVPALLADEATISQDAYDAEMRVLQIELVRAQRRLIRDGGKVLLLLEGRDAAGKDGTIKRIVEYLSPRETRVVALGKPSDRESTAWYFQRYVPHLPSAQEIVLFNRSWYNRAGVEPVMGFCSKAEHAEFMHSVPKFEEMLVNSGIQLLKYYLDIGKDEQTRRLAERARDPLKAWKRSPIDAVATKHWKDYSKARDSMLAGSHTDVAPWCIVRADDKRLARLNLIRDVLCRLQPEGKQRRAALPDPEIAFDFSPETIAAGRLAR
ncbi:MAG: polyphosphate kinase 2 [Ideonella sp.]|nr:polyphosphate kinase 2 [Ideonella sp.]